MQENFSRNLMVIAIVGTAVMAIGGTLLYLAFRAFGRAAKGDIIHIVLFVVAIGFILASCVGLFVWSMFW